VFPCGKAAQSSLLFANEYPGRHHDCRKQNRRVKNIHNHKNDTSVPSRPTFMIPAPSHPAQMVFTPDPPCPALPCPRGWACSPHRSPNLLRVWPTLGVGRVNTAGQNPPNCNTLIYIYLDYQYIYIGPTMIYIYHNPIIITNKYESPITTLPNFLS
jgi:hypothetical protein